MTERDRVEFWWPYLAILGGTIVFALVFARLDVFEAVHEFTRAHEDWELDELISAASASVVGLIAALILRSSQLRRQMRMRRAAEAEAQAMARHDALTGLPNRRYFTEHAAKMLRNADDAGEIFAVFAIDLDRFKPINDVYGHATGDRVLQIVADRVLANMPPNSLASRFGGDEFALIVPFEDDVQIIDRVARRMCLSIAEPMAIRGVELSVTASIGIALCPHDGRRIDELHSNADMAMYSAKGSGRNGVAYFEPRLGEEHRRRYELESELTQAIGRNQIVPYFQPVFDLASGEVKGFEILSRWQHPKHGVLLPEDFIPLAEDSGKISALSESVLRQACEAVAGWSQSLRFSFNLSPVQFKEPRLVERITAILDETGMRPQSLEVEITETVFIQNEGHARTVIDSLRAQGISVALDDFGKGYSSLSYLSRFEIDKLKIDRTFIAGRSTDIRNEKIVTSVIQLGKSLGIETTAEGVETGEDAIWLAEHGCSQAQGFHYSEAIPALSALRFYETHRPVGVEAGKKGKTGPARPASRR